MPQATSLASYVLQVHPKAHPDKPEHVGSIGQPTRSLLDVAGALFEELSKKQLDREDEQQLIAVRQGSLVKKADILHGFLEGGDYGFRSRIVNRQSGVLKYPRSVDDAELLPHLFMLVVPAKGPRAILLTQRTGTRGVTTSLLKALKDHVKDTLPGYVLKCAPLVPAEVRAGVLEGRLKAVTISVAKVQKDAADYYGLGGFDSTAGVLEMRYRARRGQFFSLPPWIRTLIDPHYRKSAPAGALELPDVIDKDGGRLQVTMEYRGKLRNFVVGGGIEGLAPYFDVTADLKYDKHGHVDESHLISLAEEHMGHLRTEIGVAARA